MIKHLHILAPELKRTIALSAAVLVTVGSLFAYPDFEQAKSEADQGDAQAQAVVATYYALGWQTGKDPALAAQYAKQSANAGNPLGKFRLGALLRNGEGVPKDETTGLRLQNEAAGIWSNGFDENDPFALTAIGVALFQGKVVSQDKTKAAQLYKKAADMDFAPAQYNYAMCAKDGQGIPKDTALCTEYLSKAAGSGYRLAQEALGQPVTTIASGISIDSNVLETKASAGPISGGLNLQFASTSSSTTPPTAPLLANAGPISGSFSLGGESPSASGSAATPNSTTKQLTVTGIGVDPAGAEKQAITDAVRQAVGALIDSNTLVQNEEVIRDRILSVSTGFVKEYKTTAPARKRDDGLYEITILATVATNEVAQKLKENNLISGEVAGQNLWAEASTKVMNAQDAVAMLNAKFPELIKSCLIITPLDKDLNPAMTKDASGNLVPNTAPAVFNKNSESGEATLCWAFEIGLDKKYYRESFLPLVNKCLESITESKPQKEKRKLITSEKNLSSDYTNHVGDPFRLGFNENVKVRDARPEGDIPRPSLIISYSKNYDMCEYFYYPNAKNKLIMEFPKEEVSNSMPTTRNACSLVLELQDEIGEVVAFQKIPFCWQPFRDFYLSSNIVDIIGPNVLHNYDGFNFLHRPIVFVKITMPISELKDIKNAIASLEVNDPTFSIRAIER